MDHNIFNSVFLLVLAVATGAFLYWGVTRLYQDRWQILAAVPLHRDGNGGWDGLNITFYGFFSANAYVAGALLFVILNGAAGVPFRAVAVLSAIILAACIPASSLIARIVEKKTSVFTVAGGFFTALVIMPPSVILMRKTSLLAPADLVPPIVVLAAGVIAYAFAAGIGALACISFGCCYGKPLAACSPWLQKLFAGRSFVFSGSTKKISYAHNLDAVPVVPVQALTAFLYTGTSLGACFLFLHGYFKTAFFVTVFITQGWRFFSEFIRADYRGGGAISMYQIMSVISICYTFLLILLLKSETRSAVLITEGLQYILRIDAIILLQLLWLVTFLYTGCSRVTGSKLSFFVNKDRI
ncbi:MAG: prolipoprotein diacylglyceryl transferase [Desulfobacterota bacterium]|nr:prolipoprotein diacylglyceryl transferase [Thermodesulfobacteriota bacterium]